MFVATVVVAVVLAVLLVWSAVRKLSHQPAVVQSYVRVGVPEHQLDNLAVVLLVAAGGLLGGLLWAPMGIAVAACLICYFAVAAGFHIRAKDAKNLPMPLAFGALAVAALILRLVSM